MSAAIVTVQLGSGALVQGWLVEKLPNNRAVVEVGGGEEVTGKLVAKSERMAG